MSCLEILTADTDDAFIQFQHVTKRHGETILYINTTVAEWKMTKNQRKDNASDWLSSVQTPVVIVNSSNPCIHLFVTNENGLGSERGNEIGFSADPMYFTYHLPDLKMRFGYAVSQTAVLGQTDVAPPVVPEVLARGWMRI